jgi:hypothetical protein
MAKLDDILESVILSTDGNLSIDLAKYVLGMRFTEVQATQYDLLAEKSQLGSLSAEEHEELDALVTANTLLMILKSKARRSLIGHPSAA